MNFEDYLHRLFVLGESECGSSVMAMSLIKKSIYLPNTGVDMALTYNTPRADTAVLIYLDMFSFTRMTINSIQISTGEQVIATTIPSAAGGVSLRRHLDSR